MGLGQTQNFASQAALLAYCAENPTLQAGYAPSGDTSGNASDTQTLSCSEWPEVLPPTDVTVISTNTSSTTATCLQLFGSTEPCIGGIIGEYTLLTLIAVGLGLFWFAGQKR